MRVRISRWEFYAVSSLFIRLWEVNASCVGMNPMMPLGHRHKKEGIQAITISCGSAGRLICVPTLIHLISGPKDFPTGLYTHKKDTGLNQFQEKQTAPHSGVTS